MGMIQDGSYLIGLYCMSSSQEGVRTAHEGYKTRPVHNTITTNYGESVAML